MKITYDPKYNIAYLKLQDKKTKVEMLQLSEEVNIDVSPDGKLYGIELLNAKKQLRLTKGATFTFTNESTGKSVRLPLEVWTNSVATVSGFRISGLVLPSRSFCIIYKFVQILACSMSTNCKEGGFLVERNNG